VLLDKIQPSQTSDNLVDTDKEVNNDIFVTDGSSEFKTVGSSKKSLPEKTLSNRKSNIEEFIENNQVLKLMKKYNPRLDEEETETDMCLNVGVGISNSQDLLGKGSFGTVYDAEVTQLGNVDQDKEENNIKYAVKVPTQRIDNDGLEDIEKSKLLIKKMLNFTRRTSACATLQTLELMVPVLGKVDVYLSNYCSDAMLMMKVNGQDGSGAIFGYKVQKLDEKEEYIEPIEGYNVKVCVDGGEYYCVADPKISLDIAFQKIFALRGLHDVGLVCGDVKLANVMIQKENDKYTVRLIDIGSITRKGSANFTFTKSTAAPEGFVGGKQNKKYRTNPKFDVFANAVDLPYIFFGEVAKKHLQKRYELKNSTSGEIMASFDR